MKGHPMAAEQNIDAERREYEVARAKLLKENAYPSDFDIWLLARRPSASIGEDGLPELPRKVGVIYPGNYWTASDQVAQPGAGIHAVYTADQMRQFRAEGIAADRRARGMAMEKSPESSTKPAETRMDAGFGDAGTVRAPAEEAPQAAQGVKTWQERSLGPDHLGLYPDAFACMQAEIADLRAQLAGKVSEKAAVDIAAEKWAEGWEACRAQLARQSQGEPFGYWIGMPSVGAPQFVLASEAAPEHVMRAESVVELYAAPPLSSEQQAEAPPEPEVRPCDMPACSGVSRETGSRPYCPEHREAFEEWRRERARKQQADAEEVAKARWNAQADQYNQWPELGQDEKDALIRAAGEQQAEEGGNA
jgi:hypothetical protein